MKAEIITLDNGKAGKIDLADDIFGLEARSDILHRVVRWQLAKRRSGNHKTKQRAEINGSTAKIWKQKGTGRARHSSRKAPQFRGGGVAFGPHLRDHSHGLPKKVRRLGLKTALSARQATGDIIILDDAKLEDAKTKTLKAKLVAMGLERILIIDGPEIDQNLKLAAQNLLQVDLLPSQGANVYDILRCSKLALTKAAIEQLEARLK